MIFSPVMGALLLACCFSLAVIVEPRLSSLPIYARQNRPLLETMLGDGRILFAGHFYAKADAYFHSGFYPSIFDDPAGREPEHMASDAGMIADGEEKSHLNEPRDWIDRFGRAFYPSSHTHLDTGGASHAPGELGESSEIREILPWLKIAAELDPKKIEVYTVSAYWLRNRMGKVKEAEEFLREGLRANPGSYAILFELGRIYFENHKDPERARNIWELALRRWQEQNKDAKDPDTFLYSQIAVHLALLEKQAGHYQRAIAYLKDVEAVSPNPAELEKQIAELQSLLGTPPVPPGRPNRKTSAEP